MAAGPRLAWLRVIAAPQDAAAVAARLAEVFPAASGPATRPCHDTSGHVRVYLTVPLSPGAPGSTAGHARPGHRPQEGSTRHDLS